MSLKQIARELRRNQTDEEKELWRALRGRRFAGFKFRRQHTVGDYILDFYYADAKLAVELDGFQHGLPEGIQRDVAREKFLAEQGIETLRFWNRQWHKNREGCLLEIWNAVQRRTGCVRVMKNAEKQRFIPPDLKKVKFIENQSSSPRPSPRLSEEREKTRGGTTIYAEAIQFLYGLQIFGAHFGLENTFRLAALAGNPQDRLRFIHVAGTNGKGSTCAMLESIYRASGLRVGLFTSPHLVSFRERIQVNRKLISEADVARLVEKLERGSPTRSTLKADEVSKSSEAPAPAKHCGSQTRAPKDRQDACPTLFEFATVMALKYFAEQKCDLVIWETGLGGRLDATNIVTPLASVITNIAFDHTQWLGDTLGKIAAEKAGIIKNGIPVVTGVDEPEALAVIERIAKEKNSPLIKAGQVSSLSSFEKIKKLESGKMPVLRLRGEHQQRNAALALATVEVLQSQIPVSEKQIRDGLQNMNWPGRLQLIEKSNGQKILLDGAHNLAGVETLRVALESFFPLPAKRGEGQGEGNLVSQKTTSSPRPSPPLKEEREKPALIFGALADKNWAGICRVLAPLASKIFTVRVASNRTADAGELAGVFRTANPAATVTAWDNLAGALNASKDEPFVVITGSLYLIGEALERLEFSPASMDERGLNEWTAPKV